MGGRHIGGGGGGQRTQGGLNTEMGAEAVKGLHFCTQRLKSTGHIMMSGSFIKNNPRVMQFGRLAGGVSER